VQGREEGRVQGREEGREQGRVEGREQERVENEVAKAARDKKIAEYLRSIGVSEDGVSKALSIK
jgi:predicted transposase YdaD